MKHTINTVNIVCLSSGLITELQSYDSADPQSVSFAQAAFIRKCKEIDNSLSNSEIVEALETGGYDNRNGSEVNIVWSVE